MPKHFQNSLEHPIVIIEKQRTFFIQIDWIGKIFWVLLKLS